MHAIDNPDRASELELLRSYADSIDPLTLHGLTGAFMDLRAAVDDGILSYPYSTRELVNIVRHVDK